MRCPYIVRICKYYVLCITNYVQNHTYKDGATFTLHSTIPLHIEYNNKLVELELKMELRDDVRAASITDMINPRNPLGTYSVTNFMNAKFVHPYLNSERL